MQGKTHSRIMVVMCVSIVFVILVITGTICAAGCSLKGVDMNPRNENKSKQNIRGENNTATSTGADSTIKSTGAITTGDESTILVLQTGEASILGIIMFAGLVGWAVMHSKHKTQYTTIQLLTNAIDTNHRVCKKTATDPTGDDVSRENAAVQAAAIKDLKMCIEGIASTRVEKNLQRHLLCHEAKSRLDRMNRLKGNTCA